VGQEVVKALSVEGDVKVSSTGDGVVTGVPTDEMQYDWQGCSAEWDEGNTAFRGSR